MVLFSDSDELDNRVARELTSGTGTKSMYMTIIKDINDEPMALLMCESVHEHIKKVCTDDTTLINDIASRLSSML